MALRSFQPFATHMALPPRLSALGAVLCFVLGQLFTVGLFSEFADLPEGDHFNTAWLAWASYVTCIVTLVALSIGLLRFAWRSANPSTRSLYLLCLLIAIHAVAWAALATQALRADTDFMLEQIGWALLFSLPFSSLMPLPGSLGALTLSQNALECGIFIGLYWTADHGQSALSLQLPAMLVLLCIASRLAMKRSNDRSALADMVKEQAAQKGILQNQVAHLHEVHVSRARLLAMVSHDLRQPVHALGLMLDRIQEAIPQFSDRVEVDAVNDVANSLTNSLSMLVAVTRLNSGEIVPAPEAVSLEQLFSSLNHEFKETAIQRALHLTFDHGDLHVTTDPSLIQTILANLISNSIKYSGRGEIAVRASVKGNDCIRIEVKDDGIGIATHDLPRIFEPFVRLQLRSGEEDGVGLGLAIVKQMADLIKAPLTVQSEIGRGSIFSIELPRAYPVSKSENAESRASFHGLVVVLVDNDKVVLKSMTQTLEQWGCIVVSASDWPELDSKLADVSDSIDLILSDFHLDGEVSGFDLIARLRRRQKSDIPSILLTGDVEIRPELEGALMNVVIAYKPLPSRRLAMLIYETTAATIAR